MRRHPRNHQELAAIHVREAIQLLDRIGPAMEQMRLAADPRKTSTGGGGSGMSDPTGNAVVNPDPLAAQARADRNQLRLSIEAWDQTTRTVARILQTWAPQHQINDDDQLWCPNHLRYGHREPRGQNGSKLCRWCADVQRNFGKPPTTTLIAAHRAGRRISEVEYRKELKSG